MLSLIRVAALAGILSLSVQGAVVLNGQQLRGPGPHIKTISPATNSHPAIRTDTAGALSTGAIRSGTIGLPLVSQVTKTSKAFSPPLFTPVGTPTAAGSQGAGGNGATGDANSTGQASTSVATAVPVPPVQGTPIFTSSVTSQELTLEGASATRV
ncbi:uncharacterized protein ARMOST_18451 [Armillaria ostoyae]|uniref:Uncharacterized protein n=1 Tax=Armillaria ostoyae TaxID=47428 RepID=A0A284S1W3_ARMOS|nr:uncharacterized protein ARMOST_18451 [Armillaria ostoyae]